MPARPDDPARGARPDPDAEAAWAAMERAFGEARRTGIPEREDDFELGGCPVRVRVLGESLWRRVDEAWGHLRQPRGTVSPALSVDAWDETEAGVPRPERADRIDPRSRFPFAVSADDRFVGHRWPSTLSWLDRRRRHLVVAVSDARALSVYERARPFEVPLLVWLRDQGVQLVHAALVARGGEGVLLVGASGSGKSTTALLCARSGFEFLGDDKVGLVEDAGELAGCSLGGGALLDDAHLSRFPDLYARAVRPGSPGAGDKSLVAVAELSRGRPARRAWVRALALPRVVEGAVSPPAPASRREALVATALSTALFLPIDASRSLDRLAALVARAPAFHLELGSNAGEVAARVDEVLALARNQPRTGSPP